MKVKYKRNNSQEELTILNLYASDNATSKYKRPLPKNKNLKINKNKDKLQPQSNNFNISPSETKRSNIKN